MGGRSGDDTFGQADQLYLPFGRRKLDLDKVADGLAEVLPAAFAYAMANGLAMSGPPVVRYAIRPIGRPRSCGRWPDTTVDFVRGLA